MRNRTQRNLDRAEYEQLAEWLARNATSGVFVKWRGIFNAFRECGQVAERCTLTYQQYRRYLSMRGVVDDKLPELTYFDRLRSEMCTRLLQPASYACGWDHFPSSVTSDKTSEDLTVELTLTRLWWRVREAIDRIGPAPNLGDSASEWLRDVYFCLDPKQGRPQAQRYGMYHPVRASVACTADLDKPVLPTAHAAPEEAVGLQLLAFIWDYPKQGTQQRSWGVKESSVLRGELEHAREHPGLGVSIVTTQLAQACFGSAACASRIDGCIEWALERIPKARSRLLFAEDHEQIQGCYVEKPDFRHTLAFAVILARSGREPEYVSHYRDLTLRKRKKGKRKGEYGGWPAGEGITTSELFSAIYAVEFLNVCATQEGLRARSRQTAERARDGGRIWIAGQPRWNGLWRTGSNAFKKEGDLFDALFATSWVVRRSVACLDGDTTEWSRCLEDAVACLVDAVNSTTKRRLLGQDELQRFRIEVRVASAASTTVRALQVNELNRKHVAQYLSGWRTRAFNMLRRLPLRELDVATAAFLVDSLVEPRNLAGYAHRVRSEQGD